MPKLSTAARRLFLGRPFRSDRFAHTLLPKRIALPVLAEEIFLDVDDIETRDFVHRSQKSDITVTLKIIASPHREITRPVLDYVKRASRESRRTVVTVFIPEFVVGHWWEHVLHNQSALRPLFEPGVMVAPVRWQLSSSERLKTRQPQSAPGDARRGFLD